MLNVIVLKQREDIKKEYVFGFVYKNKCMNLITNTPLYHINARLNLKYILYIGFQRNSRSGRKKSITYIPPLLTAL